MSPIATITEQIQPDDTQAGNSDSNNAIEFLVPIVRTNDLNIAYVHNNKLKLFKVKTQRAMTLYKNTENVKITAICLNQ